MKAHWKAATRQGTLAQIRLLLDQDADINSKDEHGQTALMRASLSGQTAVVTFLAERGADLNVTAKYNLSALMLAVINRRTATVQTLLAAGADQNIQGSKRAPGFYGKTVLDLARETQILGMIKLFEDGNPPG